MSEISGYKKFKSRGIVMPFLMWLQVVTQMYNETCRVGFYSPIKKLQWIELVSTQKNRDPTLHSGVKRPKRKPNLQNHLILQFKTTNPYSQSNFWTKKNETKQVRFRVHQSTCLYKSSLILYFYTPSYKM